MSPRWLINRSFRFKLSAATLVALLAMLGLLGWQTWTVLDAELRGQLHHRIEQTNLLLTSAVALPLAQRDYATLGDIANDLVKQNNAISYLVIEDHRGRRIAQAGWPAGQALPAPGGGTDRADGQVHVRQAVRFAAQTLGEFQYGVSLQFLEQARATLAEKMLKIGALGVLFGLLLLVPLGRWVTRRIEILEAAALRLAAGQLDARIDLPGEDELSRLAGAFNHMADSLSATIGEQKKAARALAYLAHHDPLTQLPNRVLLADRMAMALAQARRDGDRLGIALLDLDGFKPINDTHGHDVGDLVLIEVANRLRAALRETDTVARLGGDEFVLVLAGLDEETECPRTLARLLTTLARPYSVAGVTVTLSGSIGVTLFPDDDADADTLVRHADQAMYLAKQAGRNRFHVFDAVLDRDVQLRQGARNRVIAALPAEEFRLYYQPKVDLRAGRVIGAEALIRWQHPERGLVAPGEFLPLIEDDEFMVRLSEWVIETALAQLEQWQAQGLTLGVSVNLPARHLQAADFPAFLAGALARHPAAAPALFELEVLESAALDDVVGASARMQQCRALGVRFALDDFGTGYASLAYLRRLPIDLLKIDQSFVRDMLQDPDDLAIVKGVIGLAAAFNDTVIAEGVETIEHAVRLLHLGCDLAQGYGIARPMPPEALPAWVAAWTPDPALAVAAAATRQT